MSALRVENLAVRSRQGTILHPVSFALEPGTTVTVIGETGAGKTILAEAILGILPAELSASGTVYLGGAAFAAEERARAGLWGRTVTLLPQEPWSALDPLMRARAQVFEVLRAVHRRPRSAARAEARRELAALGLAGEGRKYPWQLSGGMAQRAALAATRATGARVLIADEPTKGLDLALRDAVVALLAAERDAGRAVLVITHDLAVAEALGGRILVLRQGRVVEEGQTREVLRAPRHPYTAALLAARPETWAPRALPQVGEAVVKARGLACRLGGRVLFDGFDLTLGEAETVAAIGPSGVGKTTLGNLLVGLMRPDRGTVARRPGLASVRFQKLWQDPPAAFAPHITLRRALADVCRRHDVAWAEAERLLAALGLSPCLLERRPDQVSGGELQRVALLRALLVRPVFLFADEPTSRLDLLTQAETLRLLADLAAERRVALFLVTHDPAIARALAHRVITLGA